MVYRPAGTGEYLVRDEYKNMQEVGITSNTGARPSNGHAIRRDRLLVAMPPLPIALGGDRR